MVDNICKRCGIEFGRKETLIKHLNRKNICMPLENDVDRKVQLELLIRKCVIECEKCNKMYKNDESLRKHKCTAIEKINRI